MKKLLFIAVCMLLIFAACEKDDSKPSSTQAKVRFTSVSSNPYKLFIDGNFKTTVSGNSYVEYNLEAGYHAFEADQVSGYILYPTVWSKTDYITAGQDVEYIFP